LIKQPWAIERGIEGPLSDSDIVGRGDKSLEVSILDGAGVDPKAVWFLRQLLPGTEMFAPMIYANDTPVANISQGTAFYREFPPGTYVFGVQNCSAAPQSAQTIPLTSGNQVALQIQSDQNGPLDCNPSVIFYINLAPAELLSDLFAPLRYLRQNE
jgi:hypothetical protein